MEERMDLTHIIRTTDDEPVNTDNMQEWKEIPSSSTTLEILQKLNPLDGKARRRLRRKQERKNKNK